MYYNDFSAFNIDTGTVNPLHLLFTYGIPTGCSGHYSYILPQNTGGMAMRSFGEGTVVENLIPQFLAQSAMTGTGGLAASIYGIGNVICALTGASSFTASINATGSIDIDFVGSGGITASISANGELSVDMTGAGDLSAGLSLFLNMLCDMTGTGGLAADATLIVSMLCDMVGGGTLTASITGQHPMSASMTGTGDLAADITAFGNMIASLIGDGDLSAGISATADMSIDIVVTGSGLSTANVVAAVWQAILSQFDDDPNSAAAKLLAAGAAGDPWSTSLPGGYTGTQAGKIIDEIKKITTLLKNLELSK